MRMKETSGMTEKRRRLEIDSTINLALSNLHSNYGYDQVEQALVPCLHVAPQV